MHSKSIFVILPLALCIAAAGCGPTDEAQLPIPDAPKEWTLPSAGEAATVGWIHSFNDSTLTRLVQEAQSHNKDLQAAAAIVIKARALAKQAGAALTPSVDLSAGATRGDSGSAQLSLGAQANWEVDLWGRIAAGEQAAQASAQAAAADYEYARHSLAAATAKAYFAAIEAELQQQAADKTAAALEKTIRIVKVQHDNGLATGQDLALARSDLAVARRAAGGNFRLASRCSSGVGIAARALSAGGVGCASDSARNAAATTGGRAVGNFGASTGHYRRRTTSRRRFRRTARSKSRTLAVH